MINGLKLKNIFKEIDKVMDENQLKLSELDAAIGDGDHGLNMNKGFNAVIEKIETMPEDNLANLVKVAGMALVSNVGGASGPLYGTAFMKASMVIVNKSEIDIKDFIEMLKAALEGIKMRGKASLGEKTMIDALEPAIKAGEVAFNEGKDEKEILSIIENAAKEGAEGTKNIVATKGRASYVGERSLTHQDAGATSMYLILKAIKESV
ncbi:MAG: dihydroxyacetone kinase subunit DhaL [Sarcina sp.]